MNLLFRFFYNIFCNIIFNTKADLMDTTTVKFRVWLNDIDLNFHMNNGRYLTILDIAKTDYLFKTGIHKIMLKEKLSGVTGGVNISFLKELKPLSVYTVETKVIDWDGMWFYIQQQFIQDGLIKANAIVKVTFLSKGKKVAPIDIMDMVPNHKKIEKPQTPKYLEEVLCGEKHMVTGIRDHNREVLRNSKL